MPPLNLADIYRLAEEMERNAARFYRTAAEQSDSEPHRVLFRELAAMEEEHAAAFARDREAAADAGRLPPDSAPARFLQAVAGGSIFDPSADPAAMLTGEETLFGILDMALQLEKDSVTFYVGLAQAGDQAAREAVETLIAEELDHVTRLSDGRQSLAEAHGGG